MDQNDYKEVFSTSYPEDLEPIVKLLSKHDIDYTVLTKDSDYNPYIAGNRPVDALRLLVAADQYEFAHGILIENGLIGNVSEEEGYRQMLEGLDNDELREMVVEAAQYPPMQVTVARTILTERGTPIDEREIAAKAQAVVDSQRKPMKIGFWGRLLWISLCIVGAPIGLIFTIAVLTMTGKDLNGNPYPIYDRPTKALANILLLISVFVTAALLILRILFLS